MRVLAAVTVAALVVLPACGEDATRTRTTATPGASKPVEWERLPPAPLSPRWGAQAVAVDDEVLVVGGWDVPACPPGAGCAAPERGPLADAAVMDLSTRTWRTVPPAPVPVDYAESAVLGTTAYLFVPGHAQARPGTEPALLAFDVATDTWTELPAPPDAGADGSWFDLVATDRELVAFRGGHEQVWQPDHAFDPATGEWRELPRDPLAPSYGRSLVWTGDELVLLAHEMVDNPNSERPSLARAAVLGASGEWRGLPDSEVLGGPWLAAGRLVVSPAAGGADGGEVNNWGRTYPNGGILDVATERWESLPEPPEPDGWTQGPWLAGDDVVVADGVFDVHSRSWREVPPPPDRPPDDAVDEGTAAALAGRTLVVWGGYRWSDGATGAFVEGGWLAEL